MDSATTKLGQSGVTVLRSQYFGTNPPAGRDDGDALGTCLLRLLNLCIARTQGGPPPQLMANPIPPLTQTMALCSANKTHSRVQDPGQYPNSQARDLRRWVSGLRQNASVVSRRTLTKGFGFWWTCSAQAALKGKLPRELPAAGARACELARL